MACAGAMHACVWKGMVGQEVRGEPGMVHAAMPYMHSPLESLQVLFKTMLVHLHGAYYTLPYLAHHTCHTYHTMHA